jgi:glycosyltransferase involved in cell wall biosynthesis
MKDTLIIIPAYNEGKTIGSLLEQLLSTDASRFADILVINDASSDNTREEVLAFQGRIRLIDHIFNQGYGASLKTGYRYAQKNDYSYVIQMDADGQHALINLSRMYERMKQPEAPDILIGSRFMQGSEGFPISFVKKTAIQYFRFIIKKSTGKKITDPTSGLQILNKKAFSYYAGYQNFDLKYPDANMIIKMLLLGYVIEEMPAVMYARQEGVSIHSGLKPVIYMVDMCISTLVVMLQYLKKGR